jgi:hypothetical protein
MYNQAMRRYLRVTFLAACVIVCLLLVALRVQSHFQVDSLELKTSSRVFQLRSWNGQLQWSHFNVLDVSQGQTFVSRPETGIRPRNPKGILGFGWLNTPSETTIFAPYWFVILLFALLASLAAAPEIKWAKRFSLRALLVTTTLLAILLGALNYLGR